MGRGSRGLALTGDKQPDLPSTLLWHRRMKNSIRGFLDWVAPGPALSWRSLGEPFPSLGLCYPTYRMGELDLH